MGFFSSKTKTKTESTSAPWAAVGSDIAGIANRLGDRAVETPFTFFPGQTYADLAPEELSALEELRAGATAFPGMVGGYLGPATQAWGGALQAPGAALDMGLQNVYDNPALQAAAEAIQSRVNRNLQENLLPAIRSRASMTGGMGGSAQSLAEGTAIRGTSDVLAEQLAMLYGNAWQAGLGAETSRYMSGLGAQQAAIGQTPMLPGLGLSAYETPANLLDRVGGTLRGQEQRGIDEAVARHRFAEEEPWARYERAIGTLLPIGSAFPEQSQTSEQKNSPSTFQNLGNVLSTGASIAGSFFGLPSLGGLMGGGLGGGMAGGMMGGLGSMMGGMMMPYMQPYPMGGGMPYINPYGMGPRSGYSMYGYGY